MEAIDLERGCYFSFERYADDAIGGSDFDHDKKDILVNRDN